MPSNHSRGGRSNNPSGRNQYSDWGVIEMARERPIAAAAAAAGAAAAGLFLWSKRSQISQQLSDLADQVGEWTENMGSNAPQMDDTAGLTTSRTSRRAIAGSRTAQGKRSSSGTRGRGTASPSRRTSETGGGDSIIGARNGGATTTTSRSGPRRSSDQS